MAGPLVALLLAWAPEVRAQDPGASPPASDIAAEFSDPLTTLPQLFLQNAFTPESYGTDANVNRLTARLIVPRVPGSSLLPFVQPACQFVLATGRTAAIGALADIPAIGRGEKGTLIDPRFPGDDVSRVSPVGHVQPMKNA